ncbi:hypothetical protein AABB24_005400 [Solanum stoloniferum]|uniref:RRM domain-containing protein n=1 Tax=Solanum stoloniferum TaxID=62892 RepID=A0ABD2UX09_9SOLN|nr:polyadenylate-binding protein 1 isoform X3 [Solanum verrucosum]
MLLLIQERETGKTDDFLLLITQTSNELIHELRKMTGEVRCFEPRRSLWPIPEPKNPTASATQAEKEEVDLRSIYVGNVDYACLPGEVKQHFQACGTVNRVTILTDKLGQPKGFAYVEFFEMEAVQNALLLNESELHGRKLKVSAKRTNVPGMKQFRGRRFNPYAGFRPRRAFVPGAPAIPPFGRVPRFRRSTRYRPY